MLAVPLIFIFLLRFGLPALTGIFPGLQSYHSLILAALCLVTAMFPAFIYAFIMLDEKDQEVVASIRVLPISPVDFILFRFLFITLLSYVFIGLVIISSGLHDWNLRKILLVSLPACLIAPVTALFIAGFARNKIEGATWMKGLNFIMFLPVLSYFIEGNYEYIMGIIPVYWVFKLFDPGYSGIPFYLNYIIALACQILFLLAGIRVFRRRVYP
jgi:fluoroquinolone transport system permease protein